MLANRDKRGWRGWRSFLGESISLSGWLERCVWTAIHDGFLLVEGMTGPLPGIHNGEGSSSSRQTLTRPSPDELDDDEAADLSLDKALLADDPLDSSNGKAPSVQCII